MDKLLVKLKFNGSGFVGWQAQQNGLSVQQCVDSAVQKIFGAHADITGCSRTDSKVHANEYCLLQPIFTRGMTLLPKSMCIKFMTAGRQTRF